MPRLLTYNVHRCVGTDRRLDVARVAAVIAEQEPDIVCLQELDVGRARTGHVDQAEASARVLAMTFQFNAAIRRLGSASSRVYVADAYGHFLGHGASVGEEHRWYWRRSLIELNAAGANELRKLWLETLREAVYA